MYCQKCGKEVTPDANFCPGCGISIAESMQDITRESGEPVLTLKPVFVPLLAILQAIPLQIFLTFWGTGVFGGVGAFVLKGLKLPFSSVFIFLFIAGLFFFGIPISFYIIKKRSYQKTEYRFYNTKLDYYEGFLTTVQKTIPYSKITEVSLSNGVLQKQYGLGTITLSTPATEGSGIKIYDIQDPDEVYQRVKKLIGKF